MTDYPRGEVAFLFTDIVGSTGLWEAHAAAMPDVYARHDAILRSAIAERHGVVYKVIGDAFQVAFPSAPAAVAATLAAQRALAAELWSLPEPLRIRSVLHLCQIEPDAGDYRSPCLNRLGRLLSVGHGSQVLLSAAVAEQASAELPSGATLRDLGERRLKDLARAERIFQLLHPDLPTDFPPLKTLDYRPHNLPVQLTPFVGRERELAAVRERLSDGEVRLVTLTGPGGLGKTRLSLQAAAEFLERFADGVFFVPLDVIADPALVPSAIADALGLREAGDRPLPDALRDHLRERELLLVLDNFEQVIAAAPLVADLLAACRRLKLLVTSRQPLRLQGEYDFAVPPLGLPASSAGARRLAPEELVRFEAVRLFVERAHAAKADFRLTAENAPAVVAICAGLDGLPLAIELAAARIKLLPPKAMLERLADPLKLLVGGGRDRTGRQQTLRGAIGWSHDLLTPDEQTLFARLAVFVGGSSLEAAEAVCDDAAGLDVFDGLASLVDQSLLRQEEDAEGNPRFVMLTTIRGYARERLAERPDGEDARLRATHAAYFLELAETAEPELTGGDQATWLDRLEVEHDNLRAALAWLERADDAEPHLRLTGALWRFWLMHGHLSEGRGWLARALARGDEVPPSIRVASLKGAGGLAHRQGEYDLARALHERELADYRQLNDRKGIAQALRNLGAVAMDRGEAAAAASLFTEGLAIARDLGDTLGMSIGVNWLGALAFHRGEDAAAIAWYDESLTLSRRLGDEHGIAIAVGNLAEARQRQGELAAATALYHDALTRFRRLGDTSSVAFALSGLGYLALAQGEGRAARGYLAEGLTAFHDVGEKAGIAECLEGLAGAAALDDEPTRAARLYGAAEALRESFGLARSAAYAADYEHHVARTRASLAANAFAAAWRDGWTLAVEDAITEATTPDC